MDITLERILSLIPKKPDGKYVHGAKKQFADALGLSHNLVTMWEKGQSQSYRGYIYEIAAKYNVSAEWLKGETDEKSPQPLSVDLGHGEIKTAPITGSGLSAEHQKLLELFERCNDNQKRLLLEMAQMMSEKKGE